MKVIIILGLIFSLISPCYSSNQRINEIIGKLKTNFSKIHDAQADLILDINLRLFGCSGNRRLKGYGYFKSPDKGMCYMEGEQWFARGNRFYKIDKKGQRYYVKLLNTLDFSRGYHPGLIKNNFELKLIKDSQKEIIIAGIPKAGVLKNTQKAYFYIDPQRYLLTAVDVKFHQKKLAGKSKIFYQKINNIWVPVACRGQNAVELKANLLIGFSFYLQTKNMKINRGLGDKLFEPGF